MSKITHEAFILKLYSSNYNFREGNFKIVGEYTGAAQRLLCKNKFGECSVTAMSLYKGCRLSIVTAVDKTNYFINQCKEIHGERYDYSKVKYEKSKSVVIIKCKIHGYFKQYPNLHLLGCGCPSCAGRPHVTTKDFIKRAREIHRNIYTYSLVKYVSAKRKVTITCKEHGEFQQTPDNHLKGRGCNKCAKYGFNKKEKAILYYIKFNGLYKIGVTKKGVLKRYERYKGKDISIIKTWGFNSGAEALQRENEIKAKYKLYLHLTKNKLTNTISKEVFNIDILKLDK